MVCQFVVEVVLFDVFVDVCFKGIAATFAFELVGLEVLQDSVLHRRGHSPAKEIGIKGTISLATIPGLQEFLCIGPCRRSAPVTLENFEDSGVVREVRLGPNLGRVLFEGLKVDEVVPLPLVIFEDRGG